MQKLSSLLLMMGLVSMAVPVAAQECFPSESFDTPGMHRFEVPSTNRVLISAQGAKGGGSRPGNGHNMGVEFDATAGDQLTLFVGGGGVTCSCAADFGGGGGGTAVVLNDSDVLLAAGAGGGSGGTLAAHIGKDGVPAVDEPPCTAGDDCGGAAVRGAGGGGFDNDGVDATITGLAGGGGKGTLLATGGGGFPSSLSCADGVGGEGWGGGGAAACGSSGGGGGGYKGGQGAGVSGGRGGFGGLSFVNLALNNGASVEPTAGSQDENGFVQIECLSEEPQPEEPPGMPAAGPWGLLGLAALLSAFAAARIRPGQAARS